jgi:gamma-glutamyltranspeptidase
MHPTPRSHRPLIMGRRGAVASNHPMATQAGLDVLRAGGNALDATIAVSLILGVVEPHMSGLGGDGFFQVLGADGQGFCVNATGAAPAAATPEAYAAGIPVAGPRSASIPGLVAGLALLHGKGAQLPWARLVAPAIEAARDGFAVTHAYAHFAGENRAKLAADPLSKARLLVEEAGAPC